MRELDALLASERPQKRTSWVLEAGMDDMLRGMDGDVSGDHSNGSEGP
jgi:hypothetical protein